MPHIKFQGHRSFGSKEEDFLKFLYGMLVCILSSAIWSIEKQVPIMLPVLFCFVI